MLYDDLRAIREDVACRGSSEEGRPLIFISPCAYGKRVLADVNYGNNNKQVRQTETDWISHRSRERSPQRLRDGGYANVHPETLAARAQTCGVRICFCRCRCRRPRGFLTFAALRLVFG